MGIAAQTLTNKTANSGWILGLYAGRALQPPATAHVTAGWSTSGPTNSRGRLFRYYSAIWWSVLLFRRCPGFQTFTFHGILDYRPLNFEETTYGNTMYQPLGTRGLAMARSSDNMIEQLGIVVSCGLQRTRTSCQPTPAPRTRTRIFFHWETKLKISLWPWSRFYWLVPTTIPNSSQLHHWHKTSTAIPSTPLSNQQPPQFNPITPSQAPTKTQPPTPPPRSTSPTPPLPPPQPQTPSSPPQTPHTPSASSKTPTPSPPKPPTSSPQSSPPPSVPDADSADSPAAKTQSGRCTEPGRRL